jgi:hypothetical protein
VWIALRWFWSFKEAVTGSLSDERIAVSSAKDAVVDGDRKLGGPTWITNTGYT